MGEPRRPAGARHCAAVQDRPRKARRHREAVDAEVRHQLGPRAYTRGVTSGRGHELCNEIAQPHGAEMWSGEVHSRVSEIAVGVLLPCSIECCTTCSLYVTFVCVRVSRRGETVSRFQLQLAL